MITLCIAFSSLKSYINKDNEIKLALPPGLWCARLPMQWSVTSNEGKNVFLLLVGSSQKHWAGHWKLYFIFVCPLKTYIHHPHIYKGPLWAGVDKLVFLFPFYLRRNYLNQSARNNPRYQLPSNCSKEPSIRLGVKGFKAQTLIRSMLLCCQNLVDIIYGWPPNQGKIGMAS